MAQQRPRGEVAGRCAEGREESGGEHELWRVGVALEEAQQRREQRVRRVRRAPRQQRRGGLQCMVYL